MPTYAQSDARILRMDGKAPLKHLGDDPLVAETPLGLLDQQITPVEALFVRNNGGIPEPYTGDPDDWRLVIDGEVDRPLDVTLGELQKRFPVVSLQLQLECGGNGRGDFDPPTKGNQWGSGAISNCLWTGVRLRDVLEEAEVRPSAVYTGCYGADPDLVGGMAEPAISRGVPIAKALDKHTLIALAVNGGPLPHIHGHPVRLIHPGWPASTGPKWLTRIWVRDRVHDGKLMGGVSYRVPITPIRPGADNDGAGFRILESMPVRCILTSHESGTKLPAGTRSLDLRGSAWAGEREAACVHVSLDHGITWAEMELERPINRFAWQRWSGRVTLPSDGYFEVWHRATDDAGVAQPFKALNWNPHGYGANAVGRVSLLVGETG